MSGAWAAGGAAVVAVVAVGGGWAGSGRAAAGPARTDRDATPGHLSHRRPGPRFGPAGPAPLEWPVAVGAVVVVAVVGGWVFGWLGATVGIAALADGRRRHVAQAGQRRRVALDGAVPDLIDLCAVAASAGHTVPGTLAVVAGRAPAAVRPALGRAGRRLDRGMAVHDAVTALGEELGPLGSPFAEALIAAHRTGAPLAPALDRVAAVARDHRRRRAEERARRLPVTMIVPLVCCVLPAFALLAVVPLVATALAGLT